MNHIALLGIFLLFFIFRISSCRIVRVSRKNLLHITIEACHSDILHGISCCLIHSLEYPGSLCCISVKICYRIVNDCAAFILILYDLLYDNTV